MCAQRRYTDHQFLGKVESTYRHELIAADFGEASPGNASVPLFTLAGLPYHLIGQHINLKTLGTSPPRTTGDAKNKMEFLTHRPPMPLPVYKPSPCHTYEIRPSSSQAYMQFR
jgi:hypothetical protein